MLKNVKSEYEEDKMHFTCKLSINIEWFDFSVFKSQRVFTTEKPSIENCSSMLAENIF